MEIVHSADDLKAYMTSALRVSFDSPVLLDRFLNDAIEVDVDVQSATVSGSSSAGIMEHIEEAGVHSGDSACSLPPFQPGQGAAGTELGATDPSYGARRSTWSD